MRICFEPNAITIEQARALHNLGMELHCYVIEKVYADVDLDRDEREYSVETYHEDVHVCAIVNDFLDIRNILNVTGAKDLSFSIDTDSRVCATLSTDAYEQAQELREFAEECFNSWRGTK